VCTIDQVLLSVLPVRHNFVRSFGVGKSVLIIDEIHAYDRYMYGLVGEVLSRQKTVGGSVILLSATLPAIQKQELLGSWAKGSGGLIDPSAPYPLITRLAGNNNPKLKTVDDTERPKPRNVHISLSITKDFDLDEELVRKITNAATGGATVAIICNLVQAAQDFTRKMRKLTIIPVDIFHARYRFVDRKEKERSAKEYYGKNGLRSNGRILIATQVIEQSLDLDFDWLISQLCPVDLLFQRMGRLHRHQRKRPAGFENPSCTILTNDGNDFGAHEKIYGDVRILWRTREKLKSCMQVIHFPEAYREWIEVVYGREEWMGSDEPDIVIGKSCAFRQEQKQKWFHAKALAKGVIQPWDDTCTNTASLTRGNEMGLNILPVVAGEELMLIDGTQQHNFNEFEWAEHIAMNSIPVPASWQKWLPRNSVNGDIQLPMELQGDAWIWKKGKYSLKYTHDFGLEKMEE
jgi:CRISPR-associated endonuclease/helicase Cas3